MEQHLAEFFCQAYLNAEQKALLAFRAASQDPQWLDVVAEAKQKHDREMAARAGGWFVELETRCMSELFAAFDQLEKRCTTDERFVVAKVEDGELRSVQFTYSLKALFYCGGSKNSEDEEAYDFAATLVGPQLTVADYDAVMKLIVKGDKNRFTSVAEELHEVLLDHLTAETNAKWQ